MGESSQIPTSLKVVAGLFVLHGAMAMVEVVVSLANSRLSINFGVLGVWIGFGLLRLSQGWRTCALVWLWLGMLGIPTILIFMLSQSGPINYVFFGQKAGLISREITVVFALILLALTIWEYRVLTKSNVRKLFNLV